MARSNHSLTILSQYWFQTLSKQTEKDESNNDTKGTECQPQDAVCIDFVGRLANDRDHDDGPIFHEAKDWLIVIGDKYVCPALEMGVRFMRVGQKAVVWSHSKFAYGLNTRKNGKYELPANSNVRFEIVIKSIFSPEEESSDPDAFQIHLALAKKKIANDMFQNELYTTNPGIEQRALRLYNKAAEEMLHLINSHATQKQEKGEAYKDEEGKLKTDQAREIMLDCLNNMVAVLLKSKKYHEAKEQAVKVLSHDPNNFKALLRAARAAMMDPGGTYDEADLAIAAAEEVVEKEGLDVTDVKKLRLELKQRRQEYKKRKKEMMARMQKGMQKSAEPPQTQSTRTSDSSKDDTLQERSTADDESKNVQETDWWQKLAPYAFQIIVPFVLYFLIVMTTKPQQEHERVEGEL
jgi:tetratricopeptide (TPR) repeat protein